MNFREFLDVMSVVCRRCAVCEAESEMVVKRNGGWVGLCLAHKDSRAIPSESAMEVLRRYRESKRKGRPGGFGGGDQFNRDWRDTPRMPHIYRDPKGNMRGDE